MTSWSRYDPVHKSGNTDHWTKLKCRKNVFRTDGKRIVPEHSVDQVSSLNNPEDRYKVLEGMISQLPANSINDNLLGHLGGKPPGDHDKLSRPSGNLQRRWMNNEYQKRAREDFRYWLISRPTPTSYGKYGIGSYKMVMGLGMAPRT